MFGIVPLTDFLITITIIQTALIVFLVAIILFNIKKSINKPTTDKIDNELSKKLSSLDTKVSLISNEFSQAIKENTENITKLSLTVNTTSASTAAALASANSSLSSLSTSPSAFFNPAMTSGLFERNTDSHFLKPEFLEIDDNDPTMETSEVVQDNKINIDPKRVQHLNTFNQKRIGEVALSTQNLESRYFFPSSLNLDSKIGLRAHSDRTALHDSASQLEKQETYQQSISKDIETAHSSSITSEHSQELHSSSKDTLKERETGGGSSSSSSNIPSNQHANHKNDEEILDSYPISHALENNKRNSNPEIDKLDTEILSALKRLGGMDETAATNEDDTSSTSTNNNETNEK